MKKKQIYMLAFDVIALLAFNIISFTVPFNKEPCFWLSYAFGMAAILIQLPVMRLAFKKGGDIKSKVYGFPIARIGAIYAVLQLIASIVFMSLNTLVPLWIPTVVYVLALCAAAVGLIATDTVRDEVIRQDMRLESKTDFMRTLQARASSIAAECDDITAKQAIKAYADKLKYSDPVSSASLSDIENELAVCTDELQNTVTNGDYTSAIQLCKKLDTTLAERNRLCRLNKSKH